MDKEPAKRPQSAEELIAELEALDKPQAPAAAKRRHGTSAVGSKKKKGGCMGLLVAGVGLLGAVGMAIALALR